MSKRGAALRQKIASAVKPALSAKVVRTFQDYQTATEQHAIIVRYLKGAIEVLPKAECELLFDFAEIAKNHCERLHRMVERQWRASAASGREGRRS